MALIPLEIKEEMINNINEGVSINNISKSLGLAKSTIYYHYKKLKGKKFKDIQLNFKSEKALGEFLGVFSGDGSFTLCNWAYDTRIYVGYYEKEYAKNLEDFLFDIFRKKPFIHKTQSVIVLRYRSKKLYQFIKKYLIWEGKKTYSVRLLTLNHSRDFLIGFLRGLLDTDGYYNKNKNMVTFDTTSNNLASQICFIIEKLLELKFSKYIFYREGRKPLHEIALYGQNSYSILNTLSPRNPNKNIN